MEKRSFAGSFRTNVATRVDWASLRVDSEALDHLGSVGICLYRDRKKQKRIEVNGKVIKANERVIFLNRSGRDKYRITEYNMDKNMRIK